MIWIGWKMICDKTGASPAAIRKAKKERNFPLHYPFGRPQVIAQEYIDWIKKQTSPKNTPNPVNMEN